ncbi:unnamed protein product [Vicia faba]|uniref:Cytochrome P450 n=1 Tax=Vicia faba TaxID=3906 RepID=A0AAV1A0W7_VICFA|nr:unnamed protein product [Vicia faba]
MELEIFFYWLLFSATLVWFFFLATKTLVKSSKTPSSSTIIPKVYPIFGYAFSLSSNFDRRVQWISDILQTISSSTFVFHYSFGSRKSSRLTLPWCNTISKRISIATVKVSYFTNPPMICSATESSPSTMRLGSFN